MLVRHPLQRAVAAYYEVRTQNATSKHRANLTQFMIDLILTHTFKVQWLDYQQICHPCQVHYDYETGNYDIRQPFTEQIARCKSHYFVCGSTHE